MRQYTDIYPSHAGADRDPQLIGVAQELGEIRGLMLTETSSDRLMQLAAQVDDSLRNWAERGNH